MTIIVCTYQRQDGHSVVLIQHGRIETGHALCPAIYPVDQLLQPGVIVARPTSTANQNTRRAAPR